MTDFITISYDRLWAVLWQSYEGAGSREVIFKLPVAHTIQPQYLSVTPDSYNLPDKQLTAPVMHYWTVRRTSHIKDLCNTKFSY